VNPIVAVFLGWLVLHEPVNPRIFVASTIIIAGVAIITVTKNIKAPAAPAPGGVVEPPRPAVVCSGARRVGSASGKT
jgi:hypothetical protein